MPVFGFYASIKDVLVFLSPSHYLVEATFVLPCGGEVEGELGLVTKT